MVDIQTFRKLALSLPDAEEQSHFHLPSFRVKKKIFATLWEKENRAMLKLSLISQSVFCSYDKSVFFPVPGGWGKQGATFVDLKKVRKDMFKDALETAYNEVVTKKKSNKNLTQPAMKKTLMSPKREKGSIPPDKSDLYDKLIETIPQAERKGATMPYTSVNGHMFSFLSKDGSLGLRLPSDAKENFLKKYKTSLCEAHGTVLKEYVAVPEKLQKNIKELKEHFKLSYEFVKSLKPKPATK